MTDSIAVDGAAIADFPAPPHVVAETSKPVASSRRGAAVPTGSIFWHLLSVGVVAGATIGVFYGIGFSLLRQPAREPAHGAVAVQHAGKGEVTGHGDNRLGGVTAPADRIGSGADTTARQPPARIPDEIDVAERPAPLRRDGIASLSAGNPPANSPASHLPKAPLADPPKVSPSALAPLSRPAVSDRLPVASYLSEAEIGVLLARGDNLLRAHDIASARFFYKWAADLGGGQAALRMAETFDPEFLRSIGAGNVSGDPTQSRFWYNRARELGASAP